MIDTLETLAVALVTFATVVAVHEYGHFWVARRAGVKVLRFSIGFGKPLFRWQGAGETEFVLSAIPLGGYVRMADEREDDLPAADLPRAFNRQPVGARMAIAAAGPAANFLLAIVVLWVLFLRGEDGRDSGDRDCFARFAGRAGRLKQSGLEIRPLMNARRPPLRP